MVDSNIEIWENIKGYEDIYQVSDLGRIRSTFNLGGHKGETYRIMNTKINHKGYVIVVFCSKSINGKGRKEFRVHRLVAETFIPNPENKPEVNHKDGNKLNCAKSNLEWNTHSENNLHAYKTGLRKVNKIQVISAQKLGADKSKKKVINININTGEIYSSVKELAELIDMKPTTLSNKLTGHRTNNTCYRYL